ncbi:lysosomal phospholipase A and acyltransferase [Halyomorpha halys]|uniref:lysosomal phospholipase A and acyltransferase n=1 Tax=Halyomorpha halys TaxID=286706 RepID=UPI0006D52958|nr:group XV phospholipase A2-like [Halyomorpha halys]
MKISLQLIVVIIGSFIVFSQASKDVKKLPPVIFVPGDGGSQLEAKLNKSTTVHYVCDKTTKDYFTLWLDVNHLLPIAIDCWVDNIKLNFDEATNKTFNQPGVETRIPNFGDPSRVEYLDPSRLAITGDYFSHIGDTLVSLGYIRGENLHGAPFDFRKGPSELGIFFENLTNLIESTYIENGNSSVVLIAHSMGGPLSLILLNNKTQSWKDKYIRALVTLSGAYGGSVKALKVFATGDDLGVYLLNETVLKQVQTTLPSSAFLMPNQFLWGDEVLVSTPDKNYTINNVESFFNDINYPIGWKMFLNEKDFTKKLVPPGVEVHCLYGVGVSTIKQLIYKSNKFPDQPLFVYEDGDGTVNIRSLEVCKDWLTKQKQEVHTQGFDGSDHMAILKDVRVINYIRDRISIWSNLYS